MLRSSLRRAALATARAAALAALPAAATAADPAAAPLILTYPQFETAVDHADLDRCPPEVAGETVFCRLTLADEALHVWVFSLDGDQPLVDLRSYPLGDGFPSF